MQRRNFLGTVGSFAAGLALAPGLTLAEDTSADVIEIAMEGSPNGARVWFDPIGLRIKPGQTVRWVNHDKGNSHTATAYHPDNDDHPQRIPEGAAAFDSGYLLPDKSFEVTFEQPGVYDYYCIPHELAGMVGRIVVAESDQDEFDDYPDDDLPDAAVEVFPSIAEILSEGSIHPKGA